MRSEVLFGEQIKNITEPSEIAMANTGAYTGTRNNPHIRSLGLTTPCFFELCTIWIRRHTVYVSVAVESKTAAKIYG